MAHEDDHRRVLGVAGDATVPEIRRAYRRLARQHHPDHNPGPESPDRFRALADAYSALNDRARRARYDTTIRRATRPDASHATPVAPRLRGVLWLSPREAQIAAVTALRLTDSNGVVIVLPAGVRDGDEVTLTAGPDTMLLTVRVNPCLKDLTRGD
ncbi:MAG: J domain-containing protein [Actinomycetota bacterium]|nr:J domain-containing protein [Actinomycetota bacterium]